MHFAHVQGLALDLVAQDVGGQAGGACRIGRCLQRLLGRGDQLVALTCKARIVGRGRLQAAIGPGGAHRIGHGNTVALHDGQRVGAGAGIAYRGAAADSGGVITRHVANGQRQHLRRRAGQRQAPAFDAREVLAHAIDLADMRPAAQQFFVDALLVGQAQSQRGQCQQRRGAARHQAQHQVVGR